MLISRTTPSGPSPTPCDSVDVTAAASSVLVGVSAAVVAVATVVVVAVSAETVKENEPSPPGVPSWLLTFQLTTQLPFGRAVVSGTVSVSRSLPTCGEPAVTGVPPQLTTMTFCWPSASLNFIWIELGDVATV